MAGHFQAIGFPVASRPDLEALGVLAANLGEPREAGDLLYLRWSAGEGVELWAQADRVSKKITGITPYFSSGKASLAGKVERVLLSSKRPHDGSISFVPAGEGRASLAGVPVALPDFALARPAEGAQVTLSVACFAHAFEVLSSEDALGASGLAPGMMLPAAQGLAILAGRVVESARRTNPSGRRDFVWALVSVAGGSLDLLLDTELRDDPLEPGQVCRAVFWACGRVNDKTCSQSGHVIG
jgi:hypothetical protein